jgi:hypothetical protein
MNYIWQLYILLNEIRINNPVNISEVTQLLLSYFILRSAVNYNYSYKYGTYNILEYFSQYYDKNFPKLAHTKENNYHQRVISCIPTNFTNFLTQDPVHLVLYANNLNNFDLEEFFIHFYKRISGIKTMLVNSGYINDDHYFKGGLPSTKFKERDLLLMYSKGFPDATKTDEQKDLVDGTYLKIDKSPEYFLVQITKLSSDYLFSISIGESTYKTPGNYAGRLGHLKLLIMVLIRTLYNDGFNDTTGLIQKYGDCQGGDTIYNMTDEKFLPVFKEISNMATPVGESLNLRSRDMFIENLVAFGCFEIARIISQVGNDKCEFLKKRVYFKRISKSTIRELYPNIMTIEDVLEQIILLFFVLNIYCSIKFLDLCCCKISKFLIIREMILVQNSH